MENENSLPRCSAASFQTIVCCLPEKVLQLMLSNLPALHTGSALIPWEEVNRGRTNCQFYTRATSAFMTHRDSLVTQGQACPSSALRQILQCRQQGRENEHLETPGGHGALTTQLSGHLSLSLPLPLKKILSSCKASSKFFIVTVYILYSCFHPFNSLVFHYSNLPFLVYKEVPVHVS